MIPDRWAALLVLLGRYRIEVRLRRDPACAAQGPLRLVPSCKDKGYLYEYEKLLGRRVRHFFVTSSLPPCATPSSRMRRFAAT